MPATKLLLESKQPITLIQKLAGKYFRIKMAEWWLPRTAVAGEIGKRIARYQD